MSQVSESADSVDGVPLAFRYPAAKAGTDHARLRDRVLRYTGVDLFPPTDAVAEAFKTGLTGVTRSLSDSLQETYHGELGARRARDLVEEAMRVGIDNVPGHQSPCGLFDEFNESRTG